MSVLNKSFEIEDMPTLNRTILLNTLIKHETIIIQDIGTAANLGFDPDEKHLQFLLDELTEGGYLMLLAGVTPNTYTITDKGIAEGKRLEEVN